MVTLFYGFDLLHTEFAAVGTSSGRTIFKRYTNKAEVSNMTRWKSETDSTKSGRTKLDPMKIRTKKNVTVMSSDL
jgi:hypothetical protein